MKRADGGPRSPGRGGGPAMKVLVVEDGSASRGFLRKG
jgi:hypothetical protein